jgi:hypothetical protein
MPRNGAQRTQMAADGESGGWMRCGYRVGTGRMQRGWPERRCATGALSPAGRFARLATAVDPTPTSGEGLCGPRGRSASAGSVVRWASDPPVAADRILPLSRTPPGTVGRDGAGRAGEGAGGWGPRADASARNCGAKVREWKKRIRPSPRMRERACAVAHHRTIVLPYQRKGGPVSATGPPQSTSARRRAGSCPCAWPCACSSSAWRVRAASTSSP